MIWVFGFSYWLYQVMQNRQKGSITIYLTVSLFFLPMSVNALTILLGDRTGNSMRTSMGFAVYYVIMVLALEDLDRRCGAAPMKAVFFLGTGLLLCNNMYFSNRLAFRQYLEYENTYAALQSVVSQLSMTPGYTAGKKLAIIGQAPPTKFMIQEFNDLNQYAEGVANLKKEYSRDEFITYFLGFNAVFADEQEIEDIQESCEFEEMPSYPDYGYIRVIRDYAVVKFSD